MSRSVQFKTPVAICWEHMATTWASSSFTHSSFSKEILMVPLGLTFNYNIIFIRLYWSIGLLRSCLCWLLFCFILHNNGAILLPSQGARSHLSPLDQTNMKQEKHREKNFAPQNTNSIIEKRSVETRTLNKNFKKTKKQRLLGYTWHWWHTHTHTQVYNRKSSV